MARTSLVFRRIDSACRSLAAAAVLLELVVERLQAHAQNLRGAGLVLAGGFKRAQNQHPLGFVHGGAHVHRTMLASLACGSTAWRFAKARRQVAGIEGAPSGQRITARSMVLRSSRTLPGQL